MAALVTSVLVLVTTVRTVKAAFPGSNGKIAFESDRDGDFEIYTMNSDGSNPTNLTNNAADDQYPTWLPDDSRIAFRSSRDGTYEIYTMYPAAPALSA